MHAFHHTSHFTLHTVPHRAGYTPADYPSDAEWRARSLIERSNAAKCPTVAYQLAGGGPLACVCVCVRSLFHTCPEVSMIQCSSGVQHARKHGTVLVGTHVGV